MPVRTLIFFGYPTSNKFFSTTHNMCEVLFVHQAMEVPMGEEC